MEAAHSSEMLITAYQTKWYHIPEDINLHSSQLLYHSLNTVLLSTFHFALHTSLCQVDHK
jgi:hypothetical protein